MKKLLLSAIVIAGLTSTSAFAEYENNCINKTQAQCELEQAKNKELKKHNKEVKKDSKAVKKHSKDAKKDSKAVKKHTKDVKKNSKRVKENKKMNKKSCGYPWTCLDD